MGIQWTFRIFDSTESLMATEKSLGLLARAMEKEGALCSGMTAATPNPQFEDFEYSSFRSFLRLLQRFGAENRATSTSAKAKACKEQQVARTIILPLFGNKVNFELILADYREFSANKYVRHTVGILSSSRVSSCRRKRHGPSY